MAQTNVPIIVCHRGWHISDHLPENSVEGILRAKQEGFQWSELDVWLSSDGVPVVMHDEKLDRTSEGTGPITRQTAEALTKLRLRDAEKQLTECRLPTLRRLKETCRASLVVEIKQKDSKELVRKVIELFHEESTDWMLHAFDAKNVRYAQEYDPKLKVAWLLDKPEQVEQGIAAKWPAMHMHFKLLNEQTAQRLMENKIALGVWTPDTEADIRRVLSFKPYMVITNQPALVRKIVGETAGGK
jgi:glycerophosphoryl diester phosphodiesterase